MEAPRSLEDRGSVTLATGDGGTRIMLAGLVDIRSARELHGTVMAARAAGSDVRIDAGAVLYLDASALQLLLALRQDLAASGSRLLLETASEAARECCRQAGVWQQLEGDTR